MISSVNLFLLIYLSTLVFPSFRHNIDAMNPTKYFTTKLTSTCISDNQEGRTARLISLKRGQEVINWRQNHTRLNWYILSEHGEYLFLTFP